MKHTRIRAMLYLRLCPVVFLALMCISARAQQPSSESTERALVEILKAKGVLTEADIARIHQTGSGAQSTTGLAAVLRDKGLITQAEYDRLVGKQDQPEDSAAVLAASVHALAHKNNSPVNSAPAQEGRAVVRLVSVETRTGNAQEPPHPTEPGAPSVVERSPSRVLNEALIPVRPLPVGGVKRGDIHPAFTAEGVGITPYGFVKVTAVRDSSSPNGDDFPLPGFISDTGPNGSPEFHLKARATRFGANFEAYDLNPKWVITGRVEADFEGNFNRSDNRNLSSVRSNNPSLRLAWGRMDYRFNSKNTFSALFGQDWTLYGSSTLPNMLETTGCGVAFGSLYERAPQMRIGYTHKAGGLSIMPEFSINLPAAGLTPSAANISNELGYGERQGADSDRPQIQGRLVGQWQLDHAPGVAPAQIIFSGFNGKRTAVVLASAIPAAYQASFSTGVSASSTQNGWDAEWQLPTRWFTLVGKFYGGSDLRWFFAGQLYSFFNDTAGLKNTVTVASVDGASNVVLGTNASGQQVVAPERPVRAEGGFIQLGIPLSRIFQVNPAGRNSGWSIYGLYGVDQAKERDLNKAAGVRHESTMMVGTINYKLNRWISFSYEQSLYTTHANPEQALPLFRGVHSREWNDVREEGGPIFFF